MCGIFGVASTRDIREFPLEAVTSTLAHRGPDDWGYYRDQHVGLGHRRLSIIDVEGGHQPVCNEDKTKYIVFNGEIYNFLELREQLIVRGHRFVTKGDTETILHAYEEWGEECVEHLSGMFAFAIWDIREQTLFVARDRLGIKPLFFAEHAGVFFCASEMKAILGTPRFPRDIDQTAMGCYFGLSYIPAPLTIFSKIRKLLPGHSLTWRDGQISIRQYWDLEFRPDYSKSESYFIDYFMDLFRKAVGSHLISEVPLGAFLSGGVDSSLVVALMQAHGPINTFTIGFGGNAGGYLDERGYARTMARRYGTNHKEYEVVPKLDGLLDTIVRAFDEPFADDSTIPSYYVCKIARENVTVALSGLGGDELFAGYERYLGLKLQGIYHQVPSFFRRLLPGVINALPERSDGHYTINHIKRFIRASSGNPDVCYTGYLSIMSPGIKASLFADADTFGKHVQFSGELLRGYFNSDRVSGEAGSVDRALYCDMKTYLPEDILAVTDRMSMQHSLEVRVPFLDHAVVEFCATIPPELRMKGFTKKYLLKHAAKGLLPPEIIHHRKQGFVGPTSRWLQTDMRADVEHILDKQFLRVHGFFNQGTIDRLLAEHFSGKEIHDKILWSLVMFQKWFHAYVDKRPDA